VIPHPLTLLLCALIGMGLSQALGYLLQFAGELCADVARLGPLSPHGLSVAYAGLGWTAALAGAFFLGAAMRLWADKSWPKAAMWGVLTALLLRAIDSGPAALFGSPRFWLLTPAGCVLGAWAVQRWERDARVAAARDAVRGLIVWERE
jgi:hypothetical protein